MAINEFKLGIKVSDLTFNTAGYMNENMFTIADLIEALQTDVQALEDAGFVKKDGTINFEAVVQGILPTIAAHLTTKNYVDVAIADAIAAIPSGSALSPISPLRSGEYQGIHTSALAASFNVAADTLYAFPRPIGETRNFDGFAMQLLTVSSAVNFRMGLYTDLDGYPDSLIVGSASALDDATVKEIAFTSQEITAQWVWFVIVADATLSSRRGLFNDSDRTPATANEILTAVRTRGWTHAFTFAALPATFPSSAPSKPTFSTLPTFFVKAA